jgi:predicted enzyme related to lactoylglutathione lyase
VTEISVFRPGDVSYLSIAAPDPGRSALFYGTVFGWKIRKDSSAFEDATGHIIGHFMADLPVAGEAGVAPYVYVQDIDQTLARVADSGGKVTAKPYPEGEHRSGNVTTEDEQLIPGTMRSGRPHPPARQSWRTKHLIQEAQT